VKDIEQAKRFYLTEPSIGVFVVNYQLPGQEEVSRFEVTGDHVLRFLQEGAAVAYRAREEVG